MASIEGALVAHLVREALEGVLTPPMASTLVFDALAAADREELPTEAEPLKRFLTRSIQPRLGDQLGAVTAASVIGQLHDLVDSALGSPVARPSQAPTANQRVDEGPVRVLIVATRPALANRLQAALGPDALTSYFAPAGETVARILGGLLPPIVLIDATEDLPLPLDELVGLVRGRDLLLLVWGSDTERGARALEVLAGPNSSAVGLRPADGAGPLMDYVLSRRAQENS